MGSLRPRLLVLGAGVHQIPLIERAEARGIEVVVADYLPNSPGKIIASHSTMASSIDTDACIEVAQKFEVDGVLTSGTDMAIVTMADVADKVGLACYLTPDTARLATDKVTMIRAIKAEGGRRPKSLEVTTEQDLTPQSLRFPVVVKPADSQGQRGVSIAGTPADLKAAVGLALDSSRSRRVIVEEFVEGSEITVNAWVQDGDVRILAVVDRETYSPPPAVGIAYRHVYPSAHVRSVREDAANQARIVASAYSLKNGPLYVQMLVSQQGVFVVEGAARIGGGHESELIPLVTGFNMVDRLINLALPDYSIEPNDRPPTANAAAVTFLFAETGIVSGTIGFNDVSCSGRGDFYVGEGDEVNFPRGGKDRVGYILSTGDTRRESLHAAHACAQTIDLTDASGRSLLHEPDPAFLLTAT